MARANRHQPQAASGVPNSASIVSSFSNIRRLADLAMVVTPGDITATQIAQQIAALSCEEVEVGVIPPKHRTDLRACRIRSFSPGQLASVRTIKWLKRMNMLDFDIFVRPGLRRDGLVEPLILLDDIPNHIVGQLEKVGLPIAVLIESSPGNFHGWIRVGDKPISNEIALEAARILAADFGGDRGAIGARQFGRLAGFTNRKSKYQSKQKLQSFAKLRKSSVLIASKGPELLALAEANIAEQRAIAASQSATVRAADELGGEKYVKHAIDAFLSLRNRAKVRHKNGSLDQSSLDFAAAAAMIKCDWHPDAIVYAMTFASPDLRQRHPDTISYARRTVDAASSSIKLPGILNLTPK